MGNEQLLTVYEADSEVEASIIEGILKQNGIETTLHKVGLSGVFGGGAGPGPESFQIQTFASQAAKAEQIILDYRSPDDQE